MLDRPHRELPHDIAAEQAFLGAILARNGVLDRIEQFQPEDLFEPFHVAIFAAMRQQWQTSRAVSVAGLKSQLFDAPASDDFNPVAYIRQLVDSGDASNFDGIASYLADLSRRRKLCELAATIEVTARDPSCSVADVAAASTDTLNDVLVGAMSRKKTVTMLGSAMDRALDAMLNGSEHNRITTGLASLDRMLGGWHRKQFAIIAGRPSMGKTTLGTSAMLRTAKKGHGVLCFSLEMPAEALAMRAMTDLAYAADRVVAYSDALNARLEAWQEERICRAASEFSGLPIAIEDRRGLTIAEIVARARQQAQKFEQDGKRLDLVVVDHLGLVRPSSRYSGHRVNEVAEISDGLATLAKDLDVAVVALCQLNRGTEARENKRPTMADIRDSGSLEQDADVIMFTYREAYYLERTKCAPGSQEEMERVTNLEAYRHSLEVLVAKQRNGETGTLDLFCDMRANAIRDLAR